MLGYVTPVFEQAKNFILSRRLSNEIKKRTADPRGGNRQPDMHHGKRLKKTVTWDYMKKNTH